MAFFRRHRATPRVPLPSLKLASIPTVYSPVPVVAPSGLLRYWTPYPLFTPYLSKNYVVIFANGTVVELTGIAYYGSRSSPA